MLSNTGIAENYPTYFIGEDDNSCSLISTIKTKYYTHKYDPTNVINNLNKYYEKKHLEEIFDLKKKSLCCKCIAISLYFKNKCNSFGLFQYLISILKTAVNVNNNLSGWILRLYIDDSVFEHIEDCINDISESDDYGYQNKEIYNKIQNMPNVEIYTYKCKKLSSNSKLRTFRFIPFIDDTVSTYVIREADGVVTNMDCRNIEIFSNSDKLFYLPDLNLDEVNNNLNISSVIRHYQSWLMQMKQYMLAIPELFKEETKQYIYNDLLAGLFSSNLKINKNYLIEKVNLANKIINTDVNSYNNDPEYLRTSNHFLRIGYDEILLYLIFNKFITFTKIEGKKYDKNYINDIYESTKIEDRFDNTIYNKENILYIYIGGNIENTINKLIEYKIIKQGTKKNNNFTYDINNHETFLYEVDCLLRLKNLNNDSKIIINIGHNEEIYGGVVANNSGLLNIPYNVVLERVISSSSNKDYLDKFYDFEKKCHNDQDIKIGGSEEDIHNYDNTDYYFKKYIKYKTKYTNLLNKSYSW